jgi:hypothetical protein
MDPTSGSGPLKRFKNRQQKEKSGQQIEWSVDPRYGFRGHTARQKCDRAKSRREPPKIKPQQEKVDEKAVARVQKDIDKVPTQEVRARPLCVNPVRQPADGPEEKGFAATATESVEDRRQRCVANVEQVSEGVKLKRVPQR